MADHKIPPPTEPHASPQPRGGLEKIARLLRYRLIVPIARGRHAGLVTARGTAIGLAFGLTPTVGVQMLLIMVFWGVMKWLKPSWRFNLIVALAWTWPTNLVTAPAYYYLCLITGRLMLGEDISLGFDAFSAHISSVMAQDLTFLESLWVYTVEIVETWGAPMMIGCIPWAILGTWAGYVLTLRFVHRLQAQQRRLAIKRRERLARKRAARAQMAANQVATNQAAGNSQVAGTPGQAPTGKPL